MDNRDLLFLLIRNKTKIFYFSAQKINRVKPQNIQIVHSAKTNASCSIYIHEVMWISSNPRVKLPVGSGAMSL